MTTDPAIRDLQARLTAIAVPTKKAWWEKYMKGVIPFRGVGIPDIRSTLAVWRSDHGLDKNPPTAQIPFALALLAEPVAEEKLAGILYLQNYLQDQLPWPELLRHYERVFTAAQIFDWNTCDWFCVRVLGPTLVREGEPFAAALSAWKDAPYLWQARSAAVPFIQVVDQPAFRPQIAAVCTTLIQRPERFAKTAVGWLLRELSRHDAPFVVDFTTRHAGSFSVESVRNAAKYLPEDTQRQLREVVKAPSGPVAGS